MMTASWVLVLLGLSAVGVKSIMSYRAAAAQAIKIMPLGDSITQGNREYASYRRPLWQKLQADGVPVRFVGSLKTNYRGRHPHRDFPQRHEGHWGWRADEILAHLPEWARDAQPDIVLLLVGGNDVNQGQDIASTIAELGQIIDELRRANPDVTTLLALLMPTSREFNEHYLALNEQIPSLALEKSTVQSPVILVDQFTGFDADQDTYDGVHPNASGEEKLAKKWYDALKPILEARHPQSLGEPASGVTNSGASTASSH